jgi:phage terminase large subunit-like protein
LQQSSTSGHHSCARRTNLDDIDLLDLDLGLVGDAADDSQNRALDDARLTDPQRLWVSVPDRLALWRGGNQLGKSFAQAFDIVHTVRGTHPYRPVPPGPVRVLVVSESWTQMDPLCEKLWALLPKDEIDERVRYEQGGGFRGFKEPRIPIVAGPGAGGVIIFATYKQGSGRIAGGSFHAAYLDEPPPESVYGEVMPRISRYHGTLRVTMTPTPDAPPMKYMRDLVERGVIREMQTSISEQAITLRGGLLERAWKTQEQINQDLAAYLDIERGMREHGDWDPVVAGRWLTAFTEDLITPEGPEGQVHVAIGVDHGAGAGRQAAVLVCCNADGSKLWFLDEAISDGRTSEREDAAAILAMLARHGWDWQDVDYWVGDRAHGGDMYGNEKSNADLLTAFSHILQIPRHKLKANGLNLHVPYKQKGSMRRGYRMMNSLFREKQCAVSMRCQGFIEAVKQWEGGLDDPMKDRLDAGRYAMEKLIDRNVMRPSIPAAARIY